MCGAELFRGVGEFSLVEQVRCLAIPAALQHFWKSVNDDIQKTADQQTHESAYCCEQRGLTLQGLNERHG